MEQEGIGLEDDARELIMDMWDTMRCVLGNSNNVVVAHNYHGLFTTLRDELSDYEERMRSLGLEVG